MLYFLFVIALIPAVFIYDGLREGEVQTPGMSPVRRSDGPVQFWSIIGIYAGMIVWIAYLAVFKVDSY